jgi:hypothetical protein
MPPPACSQVLLAWGIPETESKAPAIKAIARTNKAVRRTKIPTTPQIMPATAKKTA